MKLAIIHLSDMHIKSIDDSCIDFTKDIASHSFNYIREASHCLIFVTGDITYSGKKEQYDVAELFLLDLKKEIQDEGCEFVEIITVPGNHDCDLEEEDLARDIIIEKIVKDGKVNIEGNLIEVCTKPQNEYFEFVSKITNSKQKHYHKLWCEYEFLIDDRKIRISAINAAWMSRNPEHSGQMVFPISDFKTKLDEESDLRIALIHHPINWYGQKTYQELRNSMYERCNIVLSGHEHTEGSISSSKSHFGDCLFFESHALQPHKKNEVAGLSIYLIEDNKLKKSNFNIKNSKIIIVEQDSEFDVPEKVNSGSNHINFTESYKTRLQKHGANFLHPEKDMLSIDDVFVYPDVKYQRVDEEVNISSETLFKLDKSNKRVLILGDEKSGKTVLLKQAAKLFYTQGLVPILLKGNQFKLVGTQKIDKYLDNLIQEQYKSVDVVKSSSKDQKILLIDNVDRVQGGMKNLNPIIDYAGKHFGAIYLTASTGFKISELVNKEAINHLSNFDEYEIRKFGYKLRYRLIKKWCTCGEPNITATQLEEKIHRIEGLLTTVIGNNLVPSIPLFLLTLLQSADQNTHHDLQNSSFAYYYQFLIIQSLGKAGFKKEEIDELFSYLSHLAWYFINNNKKEITETEFQSFNAVFSERFVTVKLEKRISLLQKAQILTESEGRYSFTFPFVKYYFVGKYLADHIDDQEIDSAVNEYCQALHKRENAHSILFLTHHSNNEKIIDYIKLALKDCFNSYAPLNFDTDTVTLNTLIDSAAKFILDDIDLEKNKEKSRELRDKIADATEEEDEDEDDEDEDDEESGEDYEYMINLASKINSTIKNSEILGQILKKYYGSIERKRKEDLIKEVFDGPLRMLRFLIEDVIKDPDVFVEELTKQIKKHNSSLDDEYLEKRTRKLAFYLIGTICLGIISRVSQFVSSKKLEEDIINVVNSNSSFLSYKLIKVAIDLMSPGKMPVDEIEDMAKDLKDNKFAFMLLQSFTFYHIYMFKTDEPVKQQLCEALNIDIRNAHYAEVQASKTRMLN